MKIIINIIDISLNTIQERGKTNLGDKTIADTLNVISIKLKEVKKRNKLRRYFQDRNQTSFGKF